MRPRRSNESTDARTRSSCSPRQGPPASRRWYFTDNDRSPTTPLEPQPLPATGLSKWRSARCRCAVSSGSRRSRSRWREAASCSSLISPSNARRTSSHRITDHPIRRLLHPAFHTALIGNYEVAKFQVVGPHGLATTLFSHEYETLVQIINDHLECFRPRDLDPEVMVQCRGLGDATIALPFRDDQLALWRIARDYVDAYVDNYSADDAAVADDHDLRRWLAELDRLLPSGLYDDHGYLTAEAPLSRAMLARV